MSKYKERGPYHFVEFCNEKSDYHQHMARLASNTAEHMGSGKPCIDIGCGEGLLLNQLAGSIHDVFLVGIDADVEAIRMARLLSPSVRFELAKDLSEWPRNVLDEQYSVAVFADSLEHIQNWKEHLEWAKTHAESIVIAVPDRHDPHGLRDFKEDSFKDIFSGWRQWLAFTANCRHNFSFERT